MRYRYCILFIAFVALCALPNKSLAQIKYEADSLSVQSVNRSTLFGIGKIFLTDTYISPLQYEGTTFSLLHDRIRRSNLFDEKLLLQNQFQLQIGITDNPTKTASSYYGNLYYGLNGFYPILKYSKFRLLGGGGVNAELGGIYNERNSNNPGSLKVATNLNASALALYNWKSLTFRWQLSTPFAGMFFSPGFGHSYYEIFSLGNNKGVVHFSSFHNQLALRNYFTLDFPVGFITLRGGYLGNYYRTEVNEIITDISSHQFMIGIAAESLSFGGAHLKRNNSWLKSVYY